MSDGRAGVLFIAMGKVEDFEKTYEFEGLVRFIEEYGEKTPSFRWGYFNIGMNILRHSDFAVSNANGKTVFTIRFPPREKIDFTR